VIRVFLFGKINTFFDFFHYIKISLESKGMKAFVP